MLHSVADLLGVNSVSGRILDKAAAAICGMVRSHWQPPEGKKRIALPFSDSSPGEPRQPVARLVGSGSRRRAFV